METMTTPSEHGDQPEVPRRLGRYTLGERLGEGGMGVVYRATAGDGPDVAIKVLRPHIAHDPHARLRLEREVHTLSRVEHPRVASVLDADVHGPAPYIVTEYVPGAPLDVLVDSLGPIRGESLVRLGRGLSEALTGIHAAGIVHRDLKPGNVLMVDEDPVVIDFGIAQVADDVRLTMTGMVMGTPGYLSPEVVEGGEVTEATDWWGWAATLAFAASGQPPFGSGPMSVVLDRVIRGRSQLDGVDPELRPLLAAALDTDAERRPHASEVMEALELYAAHRPVTLALTQRQPSRRRDITPEEPWAAGSSPAVGHPEREVDPTQVQPVARTRVQPLPPRPQTRQQPQPLSPYAPPGQSAPYAPPRQSSPYAPPRQSSPYAAPGQSLPYAAPAQPASVERRSSGDPRIGRPPRTGTVAALLAVFVGCCAVAPLVGWGLLVLWSVLARTTDHAVTSMVLRRHEVGRRRSDVPMAVVTSPWHLLLATLGTVLALLLPVGFAVAATVITASGLTEFGIMTVGFEHPVPVAVGSLLGAVVAWWGPGGLSLRRGTRTLVRSLLPSELATQLVVGFLVAAGLAMAGFAFYEGSDVSWWPGGPEAPFRDLVPQVLRP